MNEQGQYTKHLTIQMHFAIYLKSSILGSMANKKSKLYHSLLFLQCKWALARHWHLDQTHPEPMPNSFLHILDDMPVAMFVPCCHDDHSSNTGLHWNFPFNCQYNVLLKIFPTCRIAFILHTENLQCFLISILGRYYWDPWWCCCH